MGQGPTLLRISAKAEVFRSQCAFVLIIATDQYKIHPDAQDEEFGLELFGRSLFGADRQRGNTMNLERRTFFQLCSACVAFLAGGSKRQVRSAPQAPSVPQARSAPQVGRGGSVKHRKNFVAIQVRPYAWLDEGIDSLLDNIQNTQQEFQDIVAGIGHHLGVGARDAWRTGFTQTPAPTARRRAGRIRTRRAIRHRGTGPPLLAVARCSPRHSAS